MSWAFTEEQINARMGEVARAAVRDTMPLEISLGDRPLVGDLSWGTEPETTTWLKANVEPPAGWAGRRTVLRVRPLGCEILAYVNGKPVQGLDGQHHEVVLADTTRVGDRFEIVLEAYSGITRPGLNPYFGTEFSPLHRLGEAEARCVDEAVAGLALDMKFAYDTARTLDPNRREYSVILQALEDAILRLDFRQGTASDAFAESAAAARRALRLALYESHGASPFAPEVWAVGHAHIDTAWLWRIAHTRKKCARTFRTALELIDRYPNYVFTCSQPQQYQYVKEDHPEIFQGIVQAVKNGRWETVGGMWVESDCNVISGESMVRQFLYGQRFFEREFGQRSQVVWLPDVFGYSAAFPQLVRQAGMRYFMTIKIFWNQVNKPPYQTFKWIGIDGSDVLVHFSPLGNYNASMSPENLQKTWDNYKQKKISDSVLHIYGFGDGGGGPTVEMLETAARAKDFIAGPKVRLASSQAFFEDLERQVADKQHLPVWNGELYLEYHRGTYTSQARTKRNNRECEFLYQAAEGIAALSMLHCGAVYPQQELQRGWEILLTNQFHDIIPGSSIHEVYVDSDADYERARAIAHAAIRSGLQALGRGARGTLIYNPLGWARTDVVSVSPEVNLPGQMVSDFDGKRGLLIELDGRVPSIGTAVLTDLPSRREGMLQVSESGIENDFFKLTLDQHGEIGALWDKRRERDVLTAPGNALLTFEDKPLNWDAWDIDVFYGDKCYPWQCLQSLKVIENGPLRAGVEIVRHLQGGRGSIVRQRVLMYRSMARIDFVTQVDWRERQTLLKVAFPVSVNSLRATYDIQFGNIERPTHWNTSWDWARFEVCGHKWADLSEGDYGVSLLSDCKYGWDVHHNVMRLTLLKSAISPDPQADEGMHEFTYSLLPHAGDWRTETVRCAYELNVPVHALQVDADGGGVGAGSLVSVDVANVIVETVKKAEDDDSVVIRLFEAYNQRGRAILCFGRLVREVHCINLLEEPMDAGVVSVDGTNVTIEVRPYEVKSLRVQFR